MVKFSLFLLSNMRAEIKTYFGISQLGMNVVYSELGKNHESLRTGELKLDTFGI